MMFTYILLYLTAINLFGLLLCGYDKSAAKKGKWRTPERHFFIISLLGGAIGVILGMKLFRHKTKHWYFVFGIPFILLVQILSVFFVIYKF